MSAQLLSDFVTENPTDKSLNIIVLIQCGELIIDYFRRFKCTENETPGHGDSKIYSVNDTFIDLFMEKTFDWLFDMMLQDFEYVVKITKKTLFKLQLYEDLYNFVRHYKLHEINR